MQFYHCERHRKASQHVKNDKFTDASYFDCLQSVRPTPQNEAITVHFKPVTLKASESKYTKVASISFDGKYCSSLHRTCRVLLKTYWSFTDCFHSLNKTLYDFEKIMGFSYLEKAYNSSEFQLFLKGLSLFMINKYLRLVITDEKLFLNFLITIVVFLC